MFQFGGFSGEDGEEKCFADIHYVDCSLSKHLVQLCLRPGHVCFT